MPIKCQGSQSVPFYLLFSQVLHLMNKMNLPAPFGHVTPTPPLVRFAMFLLGGGVAFLGLALGRTGCKEELAVGRVDC